MESIFYMVRSTNGVVYRLRDGRGFAKPTRDVGEEFVAFLYRPLVDKDYFEVNEYNLRHEKSNEAKRAYEALLAEHADKSKAYLEAVEIQKAEQSLDEQGRYARSISEIMNDPKNSNVRAALKKIAETRAAEAVAVSQVIDAGKLGGEMAE